MGRVRQKPPRTVAVLYHPKKPATRAVAEEACDTVVSLPIHPALTDPQVEAVLSAARSFFEAAR